MIYRCLFFDIRELVPPSLAAGISDHNEHRYWTLFDDRLLRAIDDIRKDLGPMFINTYALSATAQRAYGKREHSGLRLPGSRHYSVFSQHSYGRAVDAVFEQVTGDEAQKYVSDNYRRLGITGLEVGVSHLHIDFRGSRGSLVVFQPNNNKPGLA